MKRIFCILVLMIFPLCAAGCKPAADMPKANALGNVGVQQQEQTDATIITPPETQQDAESAMAQTASAEPQPTPAPEETTSATAATAADDVPEAQPPTGEAPPADAPASAEADAPETTAPVTEEVVAEPEAEPQPTPEAKTFEQLAPTVTMPFTELVGDNGVYDEIERYPAPDTYYVVVDIYHQVVAAYSRDENGEYTVPERYMVCTTGGPQDPTPGGVFGAGTHRPRFGKFYNDGVYGQYWTQVVGKIYFHSLLYSERNASTYTTSSYNRLGKRGSHGCIRLLVPDARWIYYHIAPGAQVEIRCGSKNDAEMAAIKQQLVRAPLPGSRGGTQGVANTDVWSIEELNAQLAEADSYALIDGTVVRQHGDMYAPSGRLIRFGKE